MNKVESLNHTKCGYKYHVVFIPKHRRKVLYAELRQYLSEVFIATGFNLTLIELTQKDAN